jgi:hypothetical protein
MSRLRRFLKATGPMAELPCSRCRAAATKVLASSVLLPHSKLPLNMRVGSPRVALMLQELKAVWGQDEQ